MHIDESKTAVNYTRGRSGTPIRAIAIHHWGARSQRHENVVDWFTNPAHGAQTSAHFVVSDGKVHCIVSPTDTAWHAGDWNANLETIGIELRPEATSGDYKTAAELIKWLRTQYGDLPLKPHNAYTSTACPGDWDLARLDREARGSATVGGMSPVPTGTKITQEFGASPGGYNPTGGHTGRDWGTWTGTNAASRMAGTVLWADWCHKLPGGTNGWSSRWFFDLAFGGIIVVIRHDDGVISTYSHLNSTHLNIGDRVVRGEFVGQTGNTGSATSGAHLHYEIMPATPNYNSSTYGRIHPGPYVSDPYITSTAGDTVLPSSGGTGTTIIKEWDEVATKAEVQDAVRAVVREEIAKNNKSAAETVLKYPVKLTGSHPDGTAINGNTSLFQEASWGTYRGFRDRRIESAVMAVVEAVRPSTLLAVFRSTTPVDPATPTAEEN